MVTISYHTPFPSPLDPFYLHNPEDNGARTDYYNIPYAPYFWFDGVSLVWDYINYSFYENAYLPRAATPTEVLLEVAGSYAATTADIDLTVTATFGETLSAGDYRLHVAVVEDGVEWEAPNGQSVHDHVMRRMVPDAGGTAIVLGDTYPQTHEITLGLTLDELYVPEHCEIVYFVQEMSGREVHQAGKIAVLELAAPTSTPDVVLDWDLGPGYPNPFNPRTTIPMRLERATTLELAIYAADGRLVRQLHRGVLAAGSHEFAWDGRTELGLAAASGVYFAHLKDESGRQQSRNLTLLK